MQYCVCWCFFFKQKTAYEMRISDWSSDVCSSDLAGAVDRKGDLLLRPRFAPRNELPGGRIRRLDFGTFGRICLGRLRRKCRVRALLYQRHDGQSQGRALFAPLQLYSRDDDAPARRAGAVGARHRRSEEHTYELQSIMRISYV